MSTLNADEWKNLAGTKEYYGAQAWVNWNGTGTVAIRASKNVSSITDNGTGDYTVNFTTALADANYCINTTCPVLGDQGTAYQLGPRIASGTLSNDLTLKSTTALRLLCRQAASTDLSEANVVIFAN